MKRTVAALALFLPIYPAIRLIVLWLRQYYLQPLSMSWNFFALNPLGLVNNIWFLDQQWFNRLGEQISYLEVFGACNKISMMITSNLPSADYFSSFSENGFSTLTYYQPIERFWLFQGIESIIFLLLSAILLVFALRLFKNWAV